MTTMKPGRWLVPFAFAVSMGAASSRAAAEEPPKASIPAELAVSVGSSMMLSPAVYSSARLIGGST